MYEDIIKHFWSERGNTSMTSYEADFYFFLIHECSLQEWANPFVVSTKKIERNLDCTRKTICNIRERLKQKGLINFIEGQKRKRGATYEIVYVSQRNQKVNIKKDVYVSQVNQKVNINEQETTSEHTLEHIEGKEKKKKIAEKAKLQEKRKQKEKNPPAPPIKEKINKKETHSLNAREGQGELFNIPEPKNKKVEFKPPSIDEVKAYFKKKGVVDWEEQAETFYHHYNSMGWKNINGVKIANWDSKANYWIIKQNKKHEANRRPTKTDNIKQLYNELSIISNGGTLSGDHSEIPDL